MAPCSQEHLCCPKLLQVLQVTPPSQLPAAACPHQASPVVNHNGDFHIVRVHFTSSSCQNSLPDRHCTCWKWKNCSIWNQQSHATFQSHNWNHQNYWSCRLGGGRTCCHQCRHGRGHVTQRLHGMAATYPGGFKGGCNSGKQSHQQRSKSV